MNNPAPETPETIHDIKPAEEIGNPPEGTGREPVIDSTVQANPENIEKESLPEAEFKPEPDVAPAEEALTKETELVEAVEKPMEPENAPVEAVAEEVAMDAPAEPEKAVDAVFEPEKESDKEETEVNAIPVSVEVDGLDKPWWADAEFWRTKTPAQKMHLLGVVRCLHEIE